jgi:16S rRNA (guanine527-N7)-methyltransferase
VSRAFAELSDFVTLARHLVADNGRIWAMKGIRPEGEIERLPAYAKVNRIERLRVPMLDAERHLIEIEIGAAQH